MNHFLRVPTQVPTRHVQPIPEFSPVLVLHLSHVGHHGALRMRSNVEDGCQQNIGRKPALETLEICLETPKISKNDKFMIACFNIFVVQMF